ncbi:MULTISPECIES: DUF6509 family protein [Bacillaceae]|uniref:DUF6509 family protein n=1 Tax=Bacillaceae TaxID=186817 RepID=UPI00118B86D3|nr:DUF6509 family protein [Bacillus sp. S3]QCJ43120.1 pullulanase [Bacillus sp. S3]
MNIIGHDVEKLEDPFGLLTGDRYEYFLELEVDTEDELYSEMGIGIKVIYVSDVEGDKISSYYFYERGSEKVLDFALEEDEEELVLSYCRQHREEV